MERCPNPARTFSVLAVGVFAFLASASGGSAAAHSEDRLTGRHIDAAAIVERSMIDAQLEALRTKNAVPALATHGRAEPGGDTF